MGNSVKISKPTWAKVQDAMRKADYSVAAASGIASSDRCVVYVMHSDYNNQVTIPQYGIIGFHPNGIGIHPYNNLSQFQKTPILQGVLTGEGGTDHADKNLWGIALEPIAYNKTGKVLVSGITVCKVSNTVGVDPAYATCQITGNSRHLWLVSTSNPTHCQILARFFQDAENNTWAVVKLGNPGGGGVRHAYLVSPLQLPATNTLKCRLDNATTGQMVNVKFHVFNGLISSDPGWSLSDNILPPLETTTPIPVYQVSGTYYTLWWFTGVTSCIT